MKKRLKRWLLFGLGLLIFWLGMSATSRISEAYEAACRARPRCPSIQRHIFFLNLLVIAGAFCLPWAVNTLLTSGDRDAAKLGEPPSGQESVPCLLRASGARGYGFIASA